MRKLPIVLVVLSIVGIVAMFAFFVHQGIKSPGGIEVTPAPTPSIADLPCIGKGCEFGCWNSRCLEYDEQYPPEVSRCEGNNLVVSRQTDMVCTGGMCLSGYLVAPCPFGCQFGRCLPECLLDVDCVRRGHPACDSEFRCICLDWTCQTDTILKSEVAR